MKMSSCALMTCTRAASAPIPTIMPKPSITIMAASKCVTPGRLQPPTSSVACGVRKTGHTSVPWSTCTQRGGSDLKSPSRVGISSLPAPISTQNTFSMRYAPAGRLKIPSPGSWTSPSAKMRAVCATITAPTTSPSCVASPSVCSNRTLPPAQVSRIDASEQAGTRMTCSASSRRCLLSTRLPYLLSRAFQGFHLLVS